MLILFAWMFANNLYSQILFGLSDWSGGNARTFYWIIVAIIGGIIVYWR